MSDREKFEVWAKSVFCGYTFMMYKESYLDDEYKDSYMDDEIDSAYLGWKACADSMQAEINKRDAQLESRINSLMMEFCPEEMTDEQRIDWSNSQRSIIV